MKKEIFVKRSRIDAPVETVFKWHSRPGALERLSPPWDPIQVIERKGSIRNGDRAVLKMKAGPVSYTWISEHLGYEENQIFRDRQIKGPFAYWLHTHQFEPDGKDASFLEDRIEYALKLQPFSDFIAGAQIHRKLERIFTYRHTITQQDITAHLSKPPLNVLISGASGLVGSVLIPFLTTGGNQVTRLVRRKPSTETIQKQEVFWNPVSGELDAEAIKGIDTVISLSGENIGEGRWTKEKKQRIIESRTKTTELLAKTIAKLNPKPKVMIRASAIGYYGDRGDSVMTEASGPGNAFISEVCYKWEQAAEPAIKAGIRVVFMRIGIVLTPAGAALQKLLPSFRMGVGGKIGTGNQFMSWIGIDDLIGAIYHAVHNDNIEGPVNVVAPYPVTNLDFTKTLGKVLSRPTLFTVPAPAIKLAFGQMGKELLLSGTRVHPEKLLRTGYRFRNPKLEGTFQHLLGK